MVRTSIELPEPLYKDLNHLAIDEDKTLKDLMTKAIAEYVKRRARRHPSSNPERCGVLEKKAKKKGG